MLKLSNKDLDAISQILYDCLSSQKVIAFGSRVKGNAKPYSDLDLAIVSKDPLSPLQLAQLRDAFSSSNIPYKIDLVEAHNLDTNLLNAIETHGVCLLTLNLRANTPSSPRE